MDFGNISGAYATTTTTALVLQKSSILISNTLDSTATLRWYGIVCKVKLKYSQPAHTLLR